MDTTDRWIDEFGTELDRRHMAPDRIEEAVDTVRQHVREAGGDAGTAFGDPVVYAAAIADPDDGSPAGAPALIVLALIATFVLVALSGSAWIGGSADMAPAAIASGAGLLVAAAALSVSLSRQAVAEALRERLSRDADRRWRVASSVLLLMPWTIVGFAALVLVISALR